MTKFSEQTVKYLNQAGWAPGAVVDAASFSKVLLDAGFAPNVTALRFLQEFGGLHIEYPHKRVPGMMDNMHFNSSEVVRDILPSTVAAYGAIVGGALCPIGEAARGYYILMMDETGAVYGAYGDFLVKVGDSGIEAIEALCSGKELQQIPVPDNW